MIVATRSGCFWDKAAIRQFITTPHHCLRYTKLLYSYMVWCWKRILLWWNGKYVAPQNEPNSDLVFIIGHYERHWSSRLAHLIADFLSKEWKWVIGMLIPITGLVMTYIRFF